MSSPLAQICCGDLPFFHADKNASAVTGSTRGAVETGRQDNR